MFRLQMTEAALALSEQKNHNLGELLTRVKAEKEEQRERQTRERKKEQEVQENNIKTNHYEFSDLYAGNKTYTDGALALWGLFGPTGLFFNNWHHNYG